MSIKQAQSHSRKGQFAAIFLQTIMSGFLFLSQVTYACDPFLATTVTNPVITNQVVSIPFATGETSSFNPGVVVPTLTLQCSDSTTIVRYTSDLILQWRNVGDASWTQWTNGALTSAGISIADAGTSYQFNFNYVSTAADFEFQIVESQNTNLYVEFTIQLCEVTLATSGFWADGSSSKTYPVYQADVTAETNNFDFSQCTSMVEVTNWSKWWKCENSGRCDLKSYGPYFYVNPSNRHFLTVTSTIPDTEVAAMTNIPIEKIYQFTAQNPIGTSNGWTKFTSLSGTVSVEKCAYTLPNTTGPILSYDNTTTDSLVIDKFDYGYSTSDTITVLFEEIVQTNAAAACNFSNTVTFSDDSKVIVESNTEFKKITEWDSSVTVTASSIITSSPISEVILAATAKVTLCMYKDNYDDFTTASDIYYYQSIAGQTLTLKPVQNRFPGYEAECEIASWDFQMPTGTSVTSQFSNNVLTFVASDQSIADAGSVQVFYTVSRSGALLHESTKTISFTQCTFTMSHTEGALQFGTSKTIYSSPARVQEYEYTFVTYWGEQSGCELDAYISFYNDGNPAYATITDKYKLQVPANEATSFGITLTYLLGTEQIYQGSTDLEIKACTYNTGLSDYIFEDQGTSFTDITVIQDQQGGKRTVIDLAEITNTLVSESGCELIWLEITQQSPSVSDDSNTSIALENWWTQKINVDTTSASITQEIEITVRWNTHTFTIVEKSGVITIVNCADTTQAQFSIKSADSPYEHWQQDQSDCSLSRSITASDATKMSVQLERLYTSDCADYQSFTLKSWSMDGVCGELTATISESITSDHTSWIDAQKQIVITSLQGLNNAVNSGNNAEITYVLTVTATNSAGATDQVQLELIIYACNLPPDTATVQRFVYLLNSETEMTLSFDVNDNLSTRCQETEQSFTIDGNDIALYQWLTVESIRTSGIANNGLKIASNTAQLVQTWNLDEGFIGKRKLRDQEDTFYILLCELKFQDSTIVVTTEGATDIFGVPVSGTTNYDMTLLRIVYRPTDYGSTGTTCPSFTDDVILDNSQTRTDFNAVDATYSKVEFDVSASDAAQERSFTYRGEIGDPWNYVLEQAFPVYICKTPVWSDSPFETSSSRIIQGSPTSWTIDLNSSAASEKTMTLTGLSNILPSQCNTNINLAVGDPAMASFFSWDQTNLVLTETTTSQYQMQTEITFTASNIAGPSAHDEVITVQNCIQETKQSSAISYMDDHYVLISTTHTDSLLEADWPTPLTYCEPYYFGIVIEETHEGGSWYLGGHPGQNPSIPSWINSWEQNEADNIQHFSYQIAPTNFADLKTYTFTLQIYNREYTLYGDSSTFKVELFRINLQSNPWSLPISGSSNIAKDMSADPPLFQMPLQDVYLSGDSVDTSLYFDTVFYEQMQNQDYIYNDLYFTFNKWLQNESFEDILLVDTQQCNQVSTFTKQASIAQDYATWPKTYIIKTQFKLRDSNNLQVTDINGDAILWFTDGQQFADLQVVDCNNQLVLPTSDKLIKVTNSQFWTEHTADEFTMVIGSVNSLQIQIQAASVDSYYMDLCGSISYEISLDEEGVRDDYVSFVSPNLISVNTLNTSVRDLIVTVYAKNYYNQQAIISSEFRWRECSDKTPNADDGWENDPKTTNIFDFHYTPTSESNTVMIFNEFNFETSENYCTVDVYQFQCKDPNGETSYVTYSPNDGGFTYEYVGTMCQKFDTSALGSRTISASTSKFTEDDDGTYSLTIKGWMYINTDVRSNLKSLDWTRKIQADCFSSLNVMSVSDTTLENKVIEHVIGEEATETYGANKPFTMVRIRSCTFNMYVYEETSLGSLESAESTYSYLTIDEDNHNIVVKGTTKNSDYPTSPTDLYNDYVALGQTITVDLLRSMTKQFYLHASVDSSTWKQSPLYQEIPFIVRYTLNCMYNVVSVANDNQFATKEVIQWSTIQLSMQFDKVEIDGVDDENCKIADYIQLTGNQSYRLAQKGFNETAYNGSWVSSDGWFDSTLVEMDATSDPDKIIVNFLTHNMNEIFTYDPDANNVADQKCELWVDSEHNCRQEFEIYVESWSGIVATVATFDVTFLSECFYYETHYQDSGTNQLDWWTWSAADAEKFINGYEIRADEITVNLPKFTPISSSGKEFYEVCGPIRYTISNPDGLVFSQILPTSTDEVENDTPSFNVKTDDVYKTLIEAPFVKYYTFTISVVMVNYEDCAVIDCTDSLDGLFLYPSPNDAGGLDFASTATMPSNTPVRFAVGDPCLSAKFQSTDILWYWDNHYHKAIPTIGNELSQAVMDEETVYLIQLHNHKRTGDAEWANPCGRSIYSNEWVEAELDNPLMTEINEDIWREVLDDPKFSDVTGLSPLPMAVHSYTNDDVGTYYFKFVIRVSDVEIEEIYEEVNIKINITPCVTSKTSTPSFDPIIVYFGSPKLTYQTWGSFDQYPACNYTWSYDVFGTERPNQEGSPTIYTNYKQLYSLPPVFPDIVEQIFQQSIAFKSIQLEQIGIFYDYYIAGKLDFYNSEIDFLKAKIEVVTEPLQVEIGQPYYMQFNTQPKVTIIDSILIKPGEEFKITYGQALDLEGNTVRFKDKQIIGNVNNKYTDWVEEIVGETIVDSALLIKIPDNEELVGEAFEIKINFVDDHAIDPLTTTKTVSIEVIDPYDSDDEDEHNTFKERVQEAYEKQDNNLPPPSMSIDKMNNDGQILIAFNQRFVFRPNAATDGASPARNRRRSLQSALDSGDDSFDQLARLTSENEGSKIFNIEYIASERSLDLQELQLEDTEIETQWSIEIVDTTSFYLNVEFTNAEYVSQYGNDLDRLQLSILQPEAFQSEDGKVATIEKTENLMVRVPTLMQPDFVEIEEIALTSDAFANTVKAVMAGNFFLTLALAGAMQYLYGMVNSLQVIVLCVFTNCIIPPNSKIIQIELLKTVSFDIFTTENIYNSLFGFVDSPTFSDAFGEAGLEGSNFINGLGPLFLTVIIFPFYVIIHKSSQYLFKDSGVNNRCIQKWIKPKGFFVIGMVFMFEACVEIAAQCSIFVLMINGDRFSNFGEFFSSCLAFLFVGALIFTPFYTVIAGYRLYKAKKNRDRKRVKAYKPIFADKNLKSFMAIQYSSIFILRRYALLFLIIFFPSARNTFINFSTINTLLMCCYIAHFKPFCDQSMNKQELINEQIVLVTLYLLYTFTEFVWDAETRYQIGWAQICILALNLLFNISFMAIQSCLSCKLRLRKCCVKREIKKKLVMKVKAEVTEKDRKQNFINMFKQKPHEAPPAATKYHQEETWKNQQDLSVVNENDEDLISDKENSVESEVFNGSASNSIQKPDVSPLPQKPQEEEKFVNKVDVQDTKHLEISSESEGVFTGFEKKDKEVKASHQSQNAKSSLVSAKTKNSRGPSLAKSKKKKFKLQKHPAPNKNIERPRSRSLLPSAQFESSLLRHDQQSQSQRDYSDSNRVDNQIARILGNQPNFSQAESVQNSRRSLSHEPGQSRDFVNMTSPSNQVMVPIKTKFNPQAQSNLNQIDDLISELSAVELSDYNHRKYPQPALSQSRSLFAPGPRQDEMWERPRESQRMQSNNSQFSSHGVAFRSPALNRESTFDERSPDVLRLGESQQSYSHRGLLQHRRDNLVDSLPASSRHID